MSAFFGADKTRMESVHFIWVSLSALEFARSVLVVGTFLTDHFQSHPVACIVWDWLVPHFSQGQGLLCSVLQKTQDRI
jgi:hypothetical protein